jgi:N-acetylmuramoyl-L-alanine amidase
VVVVVQRPTISWRPGNQANCYPDRRGYALEGVVLHIMDGTMAGTAAWFADPRARAGTHFGVGRDGRIEQYFSLDVGPFAHGSVEQGAVARLLAENPGVNPNFYLVGIEHEGRGGDALTEAQFDVSTRLTAWLFQDVLLPGHASGVEVDRDHILRHAEISPRSRPNCPGWPEAVLTAYVARVRALLGRDQPASVQPPPPAPAVDITALLDALTLQAAALDEIAARATIQARNLRTVVTSAGAADQAETMP